MPHQHAADAHDTITVRGARENNLRGVDVDIPKRRLTVFTGVSGSGKSSLVFDTIAAESTRMIDETYPAFVQGFLPSPARPDVEHLAGLTPAIVVDQERIGANARSTLGTATDANALLRILFSRLGEPHVGPPNAFSFNIPTITGSGATKQDKGDHTRTTVVKDFTRLGGMCPRCEGLGRVSDFDLDELYDRTLSLNEGAVRVPGYTADGWYTRIFAATGFFDMDKPLGKYGKEELDNLLWREPGKVDVEGTNFTYEGLIPKVRKSMLSKDVEKLQPHVRRFVERVITFQVCPDCHGSRLSEAARSSRIEGKSIADLCAMEIRDLRAWMDELERPAAAPLVDALRALLGHFVDIGLGYLSLDRAAGTLSGGEAQRTKLVKHLGSALTDVTYVFDEPTVGLHPHDIAAMNRLLEALRDKGNTVLVVEHKPETIAIADHVVDMGPRAGSRGGEVVYAGDLAGLEKADTLTGRHLRDRVALKDEVRSGDGAIEIRGASTNNLQGVDVDIPRGVLTVVTGVAGSGKSSLVHGALDRRDDVVVVDQGAIKGSRRSNPATYTGLLEPIRKAFAKANGVGPALFSANSEGACPACKGAGVNVTELGVMATVETPCEQCEGRRYNPEVLQYTLGGRDIAEVLDLPAEEALEFFGTGDAKIPAATKILRRLCDVGLGYLTLGQGLNSLSGGERQRIKLAVQMAGEGDVYVLDEPTSGLHLADVRHLLGLLDQLVESGKTVIVIEHHQAVMAHADWIIDLGPGAGADGGRVVYTGTPADLVALPADERTLTGEYLARYVQGA